MVDAALPVRLRWMSAGGPYAIDEPTFAGALREIRQSAGLSQRELAERIGTTQSAVARMEMGTAQPKFCTLEKLAEALQRDFCIYVMGVERV
jgi:transcriptional regulator with XRE-family HTH domain